MFFPSLIYSADMFSLLLLYVTITRSSPVYSQDFCSSSPRDQSLDVTLHLGVFVILQYFLLRMHLHSAYYYYCNRCAEAFEVYRNSLLNRLNAV